VLAERSPATVLFCSGRSASSTGRPT
jgi:hypothetical protein